jgi:hypothetical protein
MHPTIESVESSIVPEAAPLFYGAMALFAPSDALEGRR